MTAQRPGLPDRGLAGTGAAVESSLARTDEKRASVYMVLSVLRPTPGNEAFRRFLSADLPDGGAAVENDLACRGIVKGEPIKQQLRRGDPHLPTGVIQCNDLG